ncbi:FAD/NAD(P)-binding domain-containing protein [Glonium stellatum]|uniref:FAD/NAD(P)-binding domain-containing protein n=1 Tax=Glonium stellatum TaxID=574774 RepID=A0A8E2ET93_9PEZI|nr:FAD/NAD(P)-binding domain-containing protein [Glonium stellatum]
MDSVNGVKPAKPFSIAIVGGGLGGIALAIGLIKQGVPTHIYEAAAGFGEIGAGVIFGPNSARALNLIDPAMLDGFKRCATFNESADRIHTWLSWRYGMDSRDGNGKKCGDLIWHLEDEESAKLGYGTRTRCGVHRARFLDELAKLIPDGTVSFRKSLVDIDELSESKGGGIRLHFADGSSATASAVVGCDGIKSKTRGYLFNNKINPEYTGEYGYRALVPEKLAREILGDDIALNGQLYVGYGGFIITYPVEHGKLINMVGVVRNGQLWNHEQWIAPSTKEDIVKDFEGWHPVLVDLISKFEVRDKWAFFDLIHSEKYYRGRICLMGDSAHASTANLGAGAGMAMEDAFILSNLLGSINDTESLERAFKAYDSVRRPRTQKVVRLSRLAGMANEFVAPKIWDDLSKLQSDIDARYRWVWREDLEAQLAEAKRYM